MLKPIHRVACSPALAACQQLMKRFALWLCDPATTAALISKQGLQPPVLVSVVEADWLWDFLQRIDAGQSLLDRAQKVADIPPAQKAALVAWIQAVSALNMQFQSAPSLWPHNCPVANKLGWKAFKELMEAFYEKGFTSGLPFLPDGTPTARDGVNYAHYVSDFRRAHRLSPTPDSREVCVLCGGLLGDTAHVDHWIIKSAYPLLSVCADNLQLICATCNEAPNKGQKLVHSAGSFADWFHPYLRPGNRALQMNYVLAEFSVKCSASTIADQPKAAKLDKLLNLSSRWTREFKAEYRKHQEVLRRRELRQIQSGQDRHTPADIRSYIQQWQADLTASEPHHEVHRILAVAMQGPSRLDAWHTELSLL